MIHYSVTIIPDQNVVVKIIEKDSGTVIYRCELPAGNVQVFHFSDETYVKVEGL